MDDPNKLTAKLAAFTDHDLVRELWNRDSAYGSNFLTTRTMGYEGLPTRGKLCLNGIGAFEIDLSHEARAFGKLTLAYVQKKGASPVVIWQMVDIRRAGPGGVTVGTGTIEGL